MVTTRLPLYKSNPYPVTTNSRSAVVYQPDDYTLSLLMGVKPAALRCAVVLMARMGVDGLAKVPMKELRTVINQPVETMSKGLKELEQAGLIRKRTYGEYWINPKLAKPVTVAF